MILDTTNKTISRTCDHGSTTYGALFATMRPRQWAYHGSHHHGWYHHHDPDVDDDKSQKSETETAESWDQE